MIKPLLLLAKALLLSLLLSPVMSWGQWLFEPTFIHSIEINFYDTNWDHQLDSLATATVGTGSGSGRILADLSIDGIAYDSCGVRYKGNSSMDTTSSKNPFNIDLNYVIPGQNHQGKDKIKLANCFSDPSMIREVLMYELANQYIDCPRANFTKLYINGDYRGLYTNTESIDNEFLKAFYGSSKNAFVKCDPISFEIYGDNSNLAYHPDTMAYDTLYDMKSIYGLTELQSLTQNLEFNSANIGQFLDVDRTLWFLALSSAFVHNDGYTGFAHNYYLYKMDHGLWSIILWDVNMAFGGLPWNGTGFLPLNTTQMIEQDPFIHIGAPNFRPLIAQLLSIPQYNKMYVAHYRTILEENVNNGYYFQRAQWWHDLIDSEVPNEPYGFYTYQDFVDNMTLDYGTFLNLRPGLQNLMQNRQAYLYGLASFQEVPPVISGVNAPNNPLTFTSVTITADVTNETSVWLGYRYDQFDAFSKVQMFDDGAHNDGTAGDGTYGADILVNAFDVQYYIYAENATASMFSPVRAEYEFYTLTPQKTLVINELGAANFSIATDLAGEYDDWIELYNASNAAIQLNNYFLSDKADSLLKWQLPTFSLQPGSYFIVWADQDIAQPGVHANFKLSSAGESIYLSTISGDVFDMVSFPIQYADITYGRLPNGTGPFNYLIPTFGTENGQLAGEEGAEETITNSMSVYPNPASDFVVIAFEKDVHTDIEIYNLQGQLLFSNKIDGSQLKMDVRDLPVGTYIIRTKESEIRKLIVK